MTKTKVIFIMSTDHSGSTLLDLILGCHPDVFSLGELAWLNYEMTGTCGICHGTCEYWHEKASQRVLRRYFLGGRKIRKTIRKLSRFHRSIYSYLAEWFGYSTFVDSSKQPQWIRSQLEYTRHWKGMTPYLVYLTRDGRAVINSYLRKYPERGVERVTDQWKKRIGASNDLYEQFDGIKSKIAYEAIASQPDAAIRKLCQFLDISYIPDMLNYWNHDHHIVTGNAGTRSLIKQRKERGEGPVVKPGKWHGDYYDKMGQTIKLDLRWKRELELKHLAYFENHAGKLNEPFRHDT